MSAKQNLVRTNLKVSIMDQRREEERKEKQPRDPFQPRVMRFECGINKHEGACFFKPSDRSHRTARTRVIRFPGRPALVPRGEGLGDGDGLIFPNRNNILVMKLWRIRIGIYLSSKYQQIDS